MSAIEIITIVLNGRRFLDEHLMVFKTLKIPWRWHIVEGVADLKHCTAWGVCRGARIPSQFHRDGHSIDGTVEWLRSVEDRRVVPYFTKGIWEGKVEMVNAPLGRVPDPAILLQVDADEFWRTEQLHRISDLFMSDSTRDIMMVGCNFKIGPNWMLEGTGGYGGDRAAGWARAWRFKTGMRFTSHEPPILGGSSGGCFFSKDNTNAIGLLFDHRAYDTEESVAFREAYYGYRGAVLGWRMLQKCREKRVELHHYLGWVPPGVWARRTNEFFD